jgi:hypothetical protein
VGCGLDSSDSESDPVVGFCEYYNEHSMYTNDAEGHDHLSERQLLKDNSVPRS